MSTAGAEARMHVISRQLTASRDVASSLSDADIQALQQWMTHDNHELRRAIFDFLQDGLYRPNYYQSLMEFREQTLQRLQKFVAHKFFSVFDYMRDPRRFMAALECLAYCDYSLSIKAGVHFTLCGGTICKLGTAQHHATWLPRLDDLSLPGCFGMTELGHGSNVMGIQTTAVYDAAAGEFVINTPCNEASKFWIGGAAQHGRVCTVFAQLTVDGVWQGPHVFVVRIRDDAGRAMPGVTIKDCGAKMGLNGVDNGQMWFDNVRVPRDAMLNAIANVDERGRYSSAIASTSQRFGATVGGLTTGRILIAQSAVDASKVGVTIALRYAATRPQFGDTPVLSYVTHQRRLLPALACAYAQNIAMAELKRVMLGAPQHGKAEHAKLMHVLSSGLKAAATWSRTEILQNCRECCGGMGVMCDNKIGVLCNDMNVDVTFEGDNTVMMQQVAKAVLEDKNMAAADSTAAQAYSNKQRSNNGGNNEMSADDVASLLAALRGMTARSVLSGAGTGSDALDPVLDQVVELGWSHTNHFIYTTFTQYVDTTAPHACRQALRMLCMLYGLWQVERSSAALLAAGVLCKQDMQSMRLQIAGICSQLAARNGVLALQLCSGFGIPDHLLQAPIAFDWRRIGQ